MSAGAHDTLTLGYPASFLDGWTASEHAVRVHLSESALRIIDTHGRVLGLWDFAGLTVDGLQEGGLVYVGHKSAPEESLTVHDAALRERVLALRTNVIRLPGGSRRNWFAAVCLLSIAVLMGGAYWTVPTLARAIAQRIPLEQERALGMQAEAVLTYAYCDDPKARDALGRLAQRIAQAESRALEVRILRSDVPNAFALPGGLILMSDALLRDAATPEEVAGVLAHEMQHVTQRHVLAGFVRDTILTGIWALTIGDYAGLMVIDPGTAYRVANLKFSREDEASADRGAVNMLHAAGISHRGLTAFFERLQRKQGSTELALISTHPSTAQRIATLRAMPDVPAGPSDVSADDWHALKHACATVTHK